MPATAEALGVSTDGGSVIVGTSFTNQETTSYHAFRWTAQRGIQDLNILVRHFRITVTYSGGPLIVVPRTKIKSL